MGGKCSARAQHSDLYIVRASAQVTYEVEGETKEIQNLVTVERLISKKGSKNKGLISVAYLQSLSSTGLPKTAVGRIILSIYDIPREILECRWFAGRTNPVEVGIWLRNDLQSSFGSYLVCQPSEIIPHTARWPDYILAVKCLTGSEEEFYREWEEDQKHNVKYALSMAYPTRAIKTDTMPGTKQPSPPIAYIRIRRTKHCLLTCNRERPAIEDDHFCRTGRFYLFDFDKETFFTIYQLLNYYTEQKLTVDMDAALALRYPAEYHTKPILGPKPIEIPLPPMAYQTPKHATGLVIVPDKKDINYQINMITESEITPKGVAFSGKTYHAILLAEGRYSEVAFKKLKSAYFREKLFEKCLNLLYIERRRYYTELLKNTLYYVQGEEYFCKIAGFSTHDKKHGPWVAFEYVHGNPLDVALVMRKTDGLPPLTHRANFEIMYQIAAGMRYLEDNSLCHLNLRAANILVCVQHQFSMTIKITDYMLPLSILTDPPKKFDISLLHWRWMDPEALEWSKFSIKTDLWSFGCVMFEILNPGKLPYSLEKVPIEDPAGLLEFLRRGKRMTIQKGTERNIPNFILTLINCCWVTPKNRPTFGRLFTFFYDLLFDFAIGCNKAISEYHTTKGGIGTVENSNTDDVDKKGKFRRRKKKIRKH